MEIYDIDDTKPKINIQQIFLTRLKELIQNNHPQQVVKKQTNNDFSLVTLTFVGIIFAILFPISINKIGIVNTVFLVLLLVAITTFFLKHKV